MKTKLLKYPLAGAMAVAIVGLGLCLALSAANITNVNTGASSDDHSGDTLRTAFTKINTNFWWLTNNMSTLLDYAAGTSQGTLLYRGASGWTPLAPGTFGQFLKTLGPSANPAWASIPGGGDALTGNPLSQFAPTTSAQLAGVISDETGSGQAVFATSPTLTTPTLGAATATTVNKLTLTTPASGATLTIVDGKTVTHSKTMTFTSAGDSGVLTFPNATATIPATSDNLSVFAATTSAQLAGVISDETGSGPLVFATSPTLTTPVLGVASATTLNKVTLTAPASGSTITIADGRTFTVSKTMTLTSAGDGGVLTLPNATATIPATSDNLSVFAATTSAQLAGVLSDETGSGAAVFATSPTLVTPALGAATATTLVASSTVTASGFIGSGSGVGTIVLWDSDATQKGTITAPSDFTANRTFTLPDATGTFALTANNLSAFASTTSAQLAGVLSDETGSGLAVFATSPTLTTPTIGAATATSVNKVAITAPASSATLTIADGKTLTASRTVQFTSAGDSGVITLPNATATIPATSDNLSVFAATTSAQLAGVLSDETGSGLAVFATSPTLTTPTIGVATATSVNKWTFTAPTTAATLTAGADNLTYTGPSTSQTLVGTSSTDTLTNKRITARVTTITSSATPTVNSDNCDCVTITALAAAITSMTSSLSGTPNNFDQLEYRIKDDGTARAITWGASFVAGPTALPTTTTISKCLHVYFEYDTVQAKWVCMSSGSDA